MAHLAIENSSIGSAEGPESRAIERNPRLEQWAEPPNVPKSRQEAMSFERLDIAFPGLGKPREGVQDANSRLAVNCTKF